MELEELTRAIIGAAMEVHRTLGPGFLESIYGHALSRELSLRGLFTTSEFEVQVGYKEFVVGRRMDLVVENQVIVELKATQGIAGIHLAQALSYMKASSLSVSLIVNFGEPSLTWKRLVRTGIKSAQSA
jgi:GxxExxY protein